MLGPVFQSLVDLPGEADFFKMEEGGDRLLLKLTLPIYLIVFYRKSKKFWDKSLDWGEEERPLKPKPSPHFSAVNSYTHESRSDKNVADDNEFKSGRTVGE